MILTIKGEYHYLWRAVDREGNMLDLLVERQRDKQAAKKFFRKRLKELTYVPHVIVTDKLKSSGAAQRKILPGGEHRQHRSLNNRAEDSHQPTRQRAQRNHLACCYHAWVSLKVKAKELGQTRYALRASLFSHYLRAELPHPHIVAC